MSKPRMVKTRLIETKSGLPVFIRHGGFGYTLDEFSKYGNKRRRARSYDFDRPKETERCLNKAESQVGEPCQWVPGPDEEMCFIAF